MRTSIFFLLEALPRVGIQPYINTVHEKCKCEYVKGYFKASTISMIVLTYSDIVLIKGDPKTLLFTKYQLTSTP